MTNFWKEMKWYVVVMFSLLAVVVIVGAVLQPRDTSAKQKRDQQDASAAIAAAAAAPKHQEGLNVNDNEAVKRQMAEYGAHPTATSDADSRRLMIQVACRVATQTRFGPAQATWYDNFDPVDTKQLILMKARIDGIDKHKDVFLMCIYKEDGDTIQTITEIVQ
jgi:Tfp pilus assembly protein PilX